MITSFLLLSHTGGAGGGCVAWCELLKRSFPPLDRHLLCWPVTLWSQALRWKLLLKGCLSLQVVLASLGIRGSETWAGSLGAQAVGMKLQ